MNKFPDSLSVVLLSTTSCEVSKLECMIYDFYFLKFLSEVCCDPGMNCHEFFSIRSLSISGLKLQFCRAKHVIQVGLDWIKMCCFNSLNSEEVNSFETTIRVVPLLYIKVFDTFSFQFPFFTVTSCFFYLSDFCFEDSVFSLTTFYSCVFASFVTVFLFCHFVAATVSCYLLYTLIVNS